MWLIGAFVIGLACAVVSRRVPRLRDRLSVAASTIWALTAALVAAGAVLLVVPGGAAGALSLVAAGLASYGAVEAAGAVNVRARAALRRRGLVGQDRPGLLDRAERAATAHPLRVGGVNVARLVVVVWRRVIDVRVTGLAAEMTYYALISLVPLATALGAALGYLERLIGPENVAKVESQVIDAFTEVFAEQVTADVLAPLLEDLLREERAGVALGSGAIALWLASRVFRAAIRALDDAYAVPERRGLVEQWVLGLSLALGAVVVLAVVLSMVVIGPLLGGAQPLADDLGIGREFATLWAWLRWPVVAAVSVGFLVILYRYGPNVAHTWRDCVPGAVLGTLGVVAVAVGFQVYLGWAGPGATAPVGGGDQVVVAGQILGAVLAGVLWLWLSSIVVLTGGVLNAALRPAAPAERAAVGGDR